MHAVKPQASPVTGCLHLTFSSLVSLAVPDFPCSTVRPRPLGGVFLLVYYYTASRDGISLGS